MFINFEDVYFPLIHLVVLLCCPFCAGCVARFVSMISNVLLLCRLPCFLVLLGCSVFVLPIDLELLRLRHVHDQSANALMKRVSWAMMNCCFFTLEIIIGAIWSHSIVRDYSFKRKTHAHEQRQEKKGTGKELNISLTHSNLSIFVISPSLMCLRGSHFRFI